jgi:hypothetical protein
MMHRNTFTKLEEKQIKVLISKLRKSLRSDQKKIRNILRKQFDFYITQFRTSSEAFTLNDFNYCKKLKKFIIS